MKLRIFIYNNVCPFGEKKWYLVKRNGIFIAASLPPAIRWAVASGSRVIASSAG
jgi:hypothetical protein